MASVSSIKFEDREILMNLKISRDEYDAFKHDKDLLLLPVNSFDTNLVTGTLGNSNRIMLPNKVLKKNNIEVLIKNVPSKIVSTKQGKYLVIQLDGPENIPKFGTWSDENEGKEN